MLRAAELRDLDEGELEVRLADAQKELFNLRFQLATGRLDNISRIGQVRREIASIMTVSTERELGIDRVSAQAKQAGRAEIARSRPRVVAKASEDKAPESAPSAEDVDDADVTEEEE